MPYIVPSNELGEGSSKRAYNCQIVEDKPTTSVAFEVKPTYPIDSAKMCIVEIYVGEQLEEDFDAVLDKLDIAATSFKLDANELKRVFRKNEIEQASPQTRRAVMWSRDHYTIQNEYTLHQEFFKSGYAPEIYAIQIDGIPTEIPDITKHLVTGAKIHILLEKCDTVTKVENEDRFLEKLNSLVTHFVDNENLINMDFHFRNVCPLGDSLKGLDFDTKFMIIIDERDEDLKRHGKIYMLTQFLAYTRLYDNIMFDYDKIQTKLGLNYESIHAMVKYFNNNNSILSINPISQLCRYSINSRSIDCDLSSSRKMPTQENRVKWFVQRLCTNIFNNSLGQKNAKGGKRGTKRRRKMSTASPYKQSASPYKQSALPYRKNLFTFKRSRFGLKTSKL